MASLAAQSVVSSSGSGSGSGTRDSSLSSVGFCSKEIVWVPLKRQSHKNNKALKLCVKAMAVAKFKGTQMREKHLSEMIEKKVMEAKEVCEGDERSDECKVAWDEVEEVSQAKADLRRKMEKQDPLEFFCQDNPETDECRVYED